MNRPLAQHIHHIDQRRTERDEMLFETRLRRRSPPVTGLEPALLVNLSPLGFLARCPMAIIDGALISLELPLLGEVKAWSRWSMEDQVGGEFLKRIDQRDYQVVLQAIKQIQDEPDRD